MGGIKMQTTLSKPPVKYSYGPYNKYNETEQWVRLTEGCPNQCPWCYEPKEQKVFPMPEIIRKTVKIMDMNLLCKPEALSIIQTLGSKSAKTYELICGIDYRFLTQDLANALFQNRFKNIRLAWDGPYTLQMKIYDAIKILLKAGYKADSLMIFMICNHFVSTFEQNCAKLDLCKVWNVKVHDAYYDNQLPPHVQPVAWKDEQLKQFRRMVRHHNQIVLFKIDPQVRKRLDGGQ